MQQRPGAEASPPAPAACLLGIAWERIQVTLRLEPAPGTSLEPGALRLAPDRRAVAMPPTGAHAVDGVVVARFNVMQGPGQLPLGRGNWRLAVAGSDGRVRPLAVRLGAGVDPGAAAVTFPIIREDYHVRPRFEARDGSLLLEVSRTPGGIDDDEIPDDLRRLTSGPRWWAIRIARGLQRTAFVAAFRLLRLVARRNGRRILFTSDSRGALGGNLKLVYDRMVERGLDREFELLTLFRPALKVRRSLRDSIRLPWLLARADVIVIDDYQPVIYSVRVPDVRIIQLWHAVGTFKTVGYSRVGRPGAPNPFGPVHKNYTDAIVSAAEDIPIYAEAFGIPEERVVATGIPRTDRFFDPAYAATARARALEAFPEAAGRFVILFAPTFRGNSQRAASYDFGRLDYAALHALCVERDAVCLIRMHPFVRRPLGIPAAYADRLLDGSRSSLDVNDLLFAVDLLVTDYSSIIYEFSTLGRPMLFYAWDLEEYAATRDTYAPYEEFVPGRIVRTFPELLEAIRRDECDVEKVAPFAERHFQHRDGRSTDRVVDLVIGR